MEKKNIEKDANIRDFTTMVKESAHLNKSVRSTTIAALDQRLLAEVGAVGVTAFRGMSRGPVDPQAFLEELKKSKFASPVDRDEDEAANSPFVLLSP